MQEGSRWFFKKVHADYMRFKKIQESTLSLKKNKKGSAGSVRYIKSANKVFVILIIIHGTLITTVHNITYRTGIITIKKNWAWPNK